MEILTKKIKNKN